MNDIFRNTVRDIVSEDRGYILATIHRPDNTDDLGRMANVVEILGRMTSPVKLPLHPRTLAALFKHGLLIPESVEILPPQSYREILALLSGADLVLTDSGGLQKEAYWSRKPCVTVQYTTEWVELAEMGCNKLAVAADDVVAAVESFKDYDFDVPMDVYGTGDSGQKIARIIADADCISHHK